MNPIRVLRILPDGITTRWALLDGQGHVERQGTVELPALPGDGGDRETVVLVPSEAILLTRVRIPTRSRRKLIQAIPYALEDQLAGDIEALHFVPGVQQSDGGCPVAVVEHDRMRAWLGSLADAGVHPRTVIPDVLAVPMPTIAWAGVVEGDRFLLRTGRDTGFAGETENFPLLARAALEESGNDAPERIVLAGDRTEVNDSLQVAAEHDEVAPDGALARGVAEFPPSLNLCVGPYAADDAGRTRRRYWLPVAALVLAWVVLDAAHVFLERWQLEAELASLEARVEDVFYDVFPDATRSVAVRERMESELERLRGRNREASGFLDTLAAAGPHLRNGDGFRLDGLSWRGSALELELNADSLQRLDRLRQALEGETALTAEIRQAHSEEGEVRGRLLVRGPAS